MTDRDGTRTLAACGLLYLPFCFLGYGTDTDTYGVLAAGRHLLETGAYVPSRNPGYPVFELAVLGLDRLGGALLCNLATAALALWAGWSFRRIARRLDVPHAELWTAAFLLHPVVLIHATSTHDAMWALALLLGGLERGLAGRTRTAGALLALALGVRLASLAPLAGVLAVLAAAGTPWRRLAGVAGTALAGGLAWYLLPAAHAGWSTAFLAPGRWDPENWTPWLRLGKFGYKHLVFWGAPAMAAVAGIAVRARRRREAAPDRRMTAALLAAFAAGEALFLAFPIEPAYLLPTLPFALLLLGRLRPGRGAAALVLAAFALAAVVRIDVARPDVPHRARAAEYGLWLDRGLVVADVRHRLAMPRDGGLDAAREYLDDRQRGRIR